jgi:hypothetical protein
MRVARPVRKVARIVAFSVGILGLDHLGGFTGHDGYEGRSSAHPGQTGTSSSPATSVATRFRAQPKRTSWSSMSRRNRSGRLPTGWPITGTGPLTQENPYWAGAGASVHRDPDGYLVVLCPLAVG